MAASRKAEFNRRCRELEKAALDCLDHGTDTHRQRERAASKKVEHVTDLTDAFLLSVAKIDRKLGESLRALLLPAIAEWDLELDERVNYLGDLRSKPR